MTQQAFADRLGKSISTIEKYEAGPPDDLVEKCVRLALENNLRLIAEELNPSLREPTVFAPEHRAYHQMFEIVLRDPDEREAAVKAVQAFWKVTVDKGATKKNTNISEEESLLLEAYRTHEKSKNQLKAIVEGQRKRGQIAKEARGNGEKTTQEGGVDEGIAPERRGKSSGAR